VSIAATKAVLYRSGARGAAFRVLMVLADFADERGVCWPSATTVAKLARCHLRNARKTIAALVAAGELVAVGRKAHGVIVYRIAACDPDGFAGGATAADGKIATADGGEIATAAGDEIATRVEPAHGRIRQDPGGEIAISPVAKPPAKPSLEPSLNRKAAAADAPAAIDEWNGLADRYGLARVQRLTHARAGKLIARLAEIGGIEGWRIALAKIAGTPGLRGHGRSGWRVSLDWLLIEQNLTRVMEGAYHGWKDPHAADRDIGIASHGYRRRSARGSYEDVLAGIAQAVAAIEADCGDHGG